MAAAAAIKSMALADRRVSAACGCDGHNGVFEWQQNDNAAYVSSRRRILNIAQADDIRHLTSDILQTASGSSTIHNGVTDARGHRPSSIITGHSHI